MRYAVLLAVLAAAYSAPVLEKEQTGSDIIKDDIRVKRAKEQMMFGNHQNEVSNDKTKRDDPSEQLGESPVSEESAEDLTSKEPIDENLDEEPEEPVEVENPVAVADTSDDVDNFLDGFKTNDPFKKLQAEYLNLYKGRPAPEVGLYDSWQPNNYDNQYFPPSNFIGYRHRRSQIRRQNNGQTPFARVLKRSRRIKRDLVYPYDTLNQDYYPYSNDRYVQPYNNYQAQEDDISYLLDLLDNARAYEDEDDTSYVEPYSYSPYEEMDDLEYQPEPEYIVPKRQAGLTFVPGFKRSKDFFPYFEEPASHFPMFVSQKRNMRDYADEYERVMQLAAALRRNNLDPEDYSGYEEYEFRKK